MKQAIGSIPMYNIIIIFIVITFGFLSATLSYMKAFKVNGRIAKALENHEGYNILSNEEITNTLTSLGYRFADPSTLDCPEKDGKQPLGAIDGKQHYYCLYENSYYGETKYFNYGIISYIFVDLPLGIEFKIPVYSETEEIFHFSER